MTGVDLIAEERKRQIAVEGWDASHDDRYVKSEIAAAGSAYAYPVFTHDNQYTVPREWPWDSDWWTPSYDYLHWGIPTYATSNRIDHRIRDLAKAGALIAAEIDRLHRAKERS